jgi:hypothetical protein
MSFTVRLGICAFVWYTHIGVIFNLRNVLTRYCRFLAVHPVQTVGMAKRENV